MSVDINFYKLKATDGKHYILPFCLDGIHCAMQFMKKVIYEKELFTTTYTTASGKEKATISSLGRHFRYLQKYNQLFSKDYTFNPLLSFFFEQYRKHPIKGYRPLLQGKDRLDPDLFNDFVVTMRKNATATKLKKLVADWESKLKKNKKRLIEFEAELFERYARVMAVRVDCNYHKATFTPAEVDQIFDQLAEQRVRGQADVWDESDIATPSVIEGRVALEEVQNDRKRLFTNMKGKPSLFKHLAGYVWCIEYTRAAGYHLHILLFFDGSKVEKHEHIAQEIGGYWVDVITRGRGYFHNCNREKESYGENWALGRIDHWDEVKRDKLRTNALTYFCKSNQLVQVMPYAGCHLFGCGFVHRERHVRGGRPRSKGIAGHDCRRP